MIFLSYLFSIFIPRLLVLWHAAMWTPGKKYERMKGSTWESRELLDRGHSQASHIPSPTLFPVCCDWGLCDKDVFVTYSHFGLPRSSDDSERLFLVSSMRLSSWEEENSLLSLLCSSVFHFSLDIALHSKSEPVCGDSCRHYIGTCIA